MLKRLLPWLVLCAGLLAAFWYVTRPKPIAVILHTVTRGAVETTVANTRVGTIKACRRAYLAPASGGRVASLMVSEGARVAAGQVLLEVWNEDLQAQWRLETEQVAVSRAHSEEACALARLAEREARRLQAIPPKRQLVSEESVDNAVSQAQAKQAACRAAETGVAAQKARSAAASALLEKSRLRAPFAGIVAEVNVELGEYLTPSPPGIPTLPAVDLLDVGCLYVSAPIDEVDAPAIRVGQTARVSLDAFPNRKFAAGVRRIAPYVLDKEKQARTVEVEVNLEDPEALQNLLPGYSADVEILLQSKAGVIRAPSRALLEGGKVLVFQNGRLLERRLRTGLADWDYTEVLEGLAEGERIVLSLGREGVKAGAYAEADAATEP
ncbi:MAG: efflux RND transporter periplasmic adaptor subunit [Methylococcaceae bacterium]|nr:MAG: efflux RND transporter periplasmic adaptor subunit [Methylococcaceae bacterium]